jgi:hypothetical protein
VAGIGRILPRFHTRICTQENAAAPSVAAREPQNRRVGILNETISSLQRPRLLAPPRPYSAEATANRSCSSRAICQRCATFSAVLS